MVKPGDFAPEWVSPPGETIVDLLRQKNLSTSDLCSALDTKEELVERLLQGKHKITLGVAKCLSSLLGASPEFWMARDEQYQSELKRVVALGDEWLRDFPLADMVRFGWISRAPDTRSQVAETLRFFGCHAISQWHQVYSGVEAAIAKRESPTYESNSASVIAWLRKAELEASEGDFGIWDADAFRGSLDSIRALTRKKDPALFIPLLKSICRRNGVAVVVLRAPSGCAISGATKFLSPQRALLLLSARHLSDDHFWFTFFHEVAHLLLHGDRLFLEGLDADSQREGLELEANEFAERVLIPMDFRDELFRLPPRYRDVVRFAVRIGVSPGIVVGQLQHLGKLQRFQLNKAKRRYSWGKDSD